MYNTPDFYPTPPRLILRMLSHIDFRTVSSALEPSAGKGDLADAIKRRMDDNYSRYSRSTLDCIEIDPNLQHILRGKGHTVVHDDFLTFQTVKQYDLIVANFPFSDGDKHALHALSLLRAGGGQLVGLINAETLRNPYTRNRQRLIAELDALDAEVDYLPDQFTDAERPTAVEVAMISARVPARKQPSILLDSLSDATTDTARGSERTEIADTDPVQNMVARFNLECRAGSRLITEYDALQPLMLNKLDLGTDDDGMKYANPIIKLDLSTEYGESRVNAYVRAIRHKYWYALIGNPRFRANYTSAILKALDGKMDQLQNKDFTAFNIRQLDAELRGEIPGSVEDAILELFDDLSRKFAYVEGSGNNVHYYNGWKTNRAHKINTKVILPVNGFSSWGYERNHLNTMYITERLADMIKVFQYLDGAPVSAEQIAVQRVREANDTGKFRNIDCHYFTATFYKKGTCHIRFTNQDLLDKFNIFGSQRKGWLPPSYGKRQYRDMSREEQSVIDEFQGQMAYDTVMTRRDYFLSVAVTPQLGMGQAA